MNVLGWIILGLIAGSLAQTVTGFEKRGCLFSMVVGIIGAFIGASVLCLGLKVLERRE